MLNRKGKDKSQRKSLSLKKSKVKESAAGKPSTTGRQADISTFFQKNVLTKSNGEVLEKTISNKVLENSPAASSSDSLVQKYTKLCQGGDDKNHHSACDSGAQPKMKKVNSENITGKNRNASSSEDKCEVVDVGTGIDGTGIDRSSFESDEEFADGSKSNSYVKRATLKNELVSEKSHNSSKLHLSSCVLTKNDIQGSRSPALGRNIDPMTASPGPYIVPADVQVIPPTPPVNLTFRKNAISKRGQTSGFLSGRNNPRRQASYSLKNKLKCSATNRGGIIGDKPTMKKQDARKMQLKAGEGAHTSKKGNHSFFEENTNDDCEILHVLHKNLRQGPADEELTDSSNENENESTRARTVAVRSSLQRARKTFKLARKTKKSQAEVGAKSSTPSSRIPSSGDCPETTREDLNVLSDYGADLTSLVNEISMGAPKDFRRLAGKRCEAGAKSSTPSSRKSIAAVFKSGNVPTISKREELDVLSGYGGGISFADEMSTEAPMDSRRWGDAALERCKVEVPAQGVTNGRSLKRFGEKGISPREKRFSPMAPESTMKPIKRNLLAQLSHGAEYSNVDDDETQPISEDTQYLETRNLLSSRDTASNEEKPAAPRQCNDFLDLSMNSLNNDDEMRELMDGVQWSPLGKTTTPKSKPLVSPAKLYVRSKSVELSCLTSNLTVKENANDTCKETGKEGYRRYLVLEVYRREIMDEITPNTGASEKVLRLFDESNNTERYCQLRDDWERTEVEHGDIVNIIAADEPFKTGSYILDNQKENYVIVLPDILVTPTAISSSTKCLRRSVLEKHFKTEGQNEVMFLGTLLHTIFDAALMSKDFSSKSVLDQTKQLLHKLPNLTELYGLGVSEDDILSKVAEQTADMADWGQKFVRDEPHAIHGIINFKDGVSQKSNSPDSVAVCVSKIVDIEECVWSPKFGLKGQMDATVEVKINKNPNIMKKNIASYENYVLPLELKTGKLYSKLGSVEHRAQVILYTLLMMDRYPHTMDTGLLVYIKTAHMLGVPAYLHEKRALVMKRNEMVRFLSYSGTRFLQNMPGMLQDQRTCNYCPQLKVCTLYHKSVEKGNSESAGIGKLFDKMTSHLCPAHLEYFKRWNKLIALESQAIKENGREPDIWGLSGLEREQLGYCFSTMLLVSCKPSDDETGRFVNTFVKREPQSARVSVADMHLTKGDYIVVSLEDGIVALATGFLLEVSDESISVLLNKDLTQCYHHINAADGQGSYRIDKAEISTGVVIQWSNLAKLFFVDGEQDAKLRRLIVDLESPTFTRQKDMLSNVTSSQVSEVWSSQMSACSMSSPIKSSQCGDELMTILNDLNMDQRKAITKVLAAQDYSLVLGMPGTGKTTTIACLVRTLVTLGKSVLLTSYTHSAVDNILLKLKQNGVDFLRLGTAQKIHPDIQSYGVNNAAKHVQTVKELKEFYESKLVVATTCLGVNHTLFNQRFFDYCIVDEASQITQPVCFGSLRHASIFVLVGDHYQLPPLVQSHEARIGGMDISLFKRLSENHPQAVVSLEHQYRMHKDIMLLSNSLIYEHRLKCGTEEVAERLLDLPNWDSLREMVFQMDKQQQVPCTWLLEVLDPHSPVIFLDTDDLPAPEVRSGHNVYNEKEAAIVASITHALIKSGLDADSIGVISPYRHQLKVIKKHVEAETGNCTSSLSDVEISTVDKYQGRDKRCVVVSLVRCNDGGHVGDLLRDWRRVNVALTRAKQKLILLGSRKTLKTNILFQELLGILEERCWVYNLQKDAWRMKLL